MPFKVALRFVTSLPRGDLLLGFDSPGDADKARRTYREWASETAPRLEPATPFAAHAVVLHRVPLDAPETALLRSLASIAECEVVSIRRLPARSPFARFGSAVAVLLEEDGAARVARTESCIVESAQVWVERWDGARKKKEKRQLAHPIEQCKEGDAAPKKKKTVPRRAQAEAQPRVGHLRLAGGGRGAREGEGERVGAGGEEAEQEVSGWCPSSRG